MRPSTTALAFGPAVALLVAAAAAEPPPRAGDVPSAGPAHSAAPPAPSAPKAPKAPKGTPTADQADVPVPDTVPAPEPELHAEPVPIPSDTEAAPEPSPSAAHAGPPPPMVTPVRREPKKEEPVEPVKPARDTLGGHFVVGVTAGMVLPFGDIASGIPQSRTMGVGLSLGGDIAYGVSRTVMLGAYVDVGLPGAQGGSSNDSIATFAVGPMIRYHLVQGIPFDPWLSAGFGFRRTSDGPTSYTGIDWARISLGGDWYPASNFGFGPFIEVAMGTFFAENPNSIGSKALNAHFVLGGRIVFDAPGK